MQPRLFSCAHQSGTPTFLFNAMQISKKSQSLTMNAAGRKTSFQHTCVHTHSTYTHVTRARASCKESMDQIWIRTLNIFNLLKGNSIFKSPDKHEIREKKFFLNLWENIKKSQLMTRWNIPPFLLWFAKQVRGKSNRIQHLPTHLANNMEDLLYIFIQMKILFAQHLFLQLVETPPRKEHKRKAISCNGPFYLFCNFLPKLHRYNYFDTIMKRKWDLGTVGLSNNTISCQTSQHWQSQRTLSIPIGNIWFYCRNIIYFHQVAIIRKDMIAE